MTDHCLFHVKKGSSTEQALLELSPYLSDIYEIEDLNTHRTQIGGFALQKIGKSQKFRHCILEKISTAGEIDWEEQWQTFACSFRDGLAHIDLAHFGGPVLLLKPGSGFGDFSHPTTRLTMTLMAPLVKNKILYDIGCGSGILSIASIFLGAKKAYGIDLEKSAIAHSKENASINAVEKKTEFATAIKPSWPTKGSHIIAMNMIASEQKEAWKALPMLHSTKSTIITSGILSWQKEDYLSLVTSWGWTLQKEMEEDGWTGFVFQTNPR